jgi:hypothetical protein
MNTIGYHCFKCGVKISARDASNGIYCSQKCEDAYNKEPVSWKPLPMPSSAQRAAEKIQAHYFIGFGTPARARRDRDKLAAIISAEYAAAEAIVAWARGQASKGHANYCWLPLGGTKCDCGMTT